MPLVVSAATVVATIILWMLGISVYDMIMTRLGRTSSIWGFHVVGFVVVGLPAYAVAGICPELALHWNGLYWSLIVHAFGVFVYVVMAIAGESEFGCLWAALIAVVLGVLVTGSTARMVDHATRHRKAAAQATGDIFLRRGAAVANGRGRRPTEEDSLAKGDKIG